ncbi:D-galactarolactone isomerase [Variovorax sp. TBS-050B]|uniref:amidohydrolase family protein n=1 Tax=Variovorax sp. TBS-050B TaxID=2940551 RepID=UPI002473166A|nr:amidohydrolase family protein [Variovorax sp. TBS-050B]MDH6590296.1 D-galactarolactone isomerase [Variovorax sp. TBS-050B]
MTERAAHPGPGPAAPFSAGTGRTAVEVPAGACDCHVHLYDARYPAVAGAKLLPPDAGADDYRLLQQRTGTARAVFVTPSTYGVDNRALLDALDAFGEAARGVAVIGPDTGDETLHALHARGVRGVRLNLSLGVANDAADLLPLARRIAPLGWHLQLLAPPDLLLGLAPALEALPVPLVFDHFGRLAPSMAGRHGAHALILRLLRAGRAWVKLSGGYIVSERPAPHDDLMPLARSCIEAAPERVLWGSDWPHASASAGHQPMPDDARQMDQLAQWAGTAGVLRRILVDNPAALYGFDLPPTTNRETS